MTPPVRLVAAALWVLVAAGPVLGVVALLRAPDTPAPAGPLYPPPGVTGMAELAVRAHLGSLPGEAPTALSPAHPALRLGPSALEGLTTEARQAAVAATAVPLHAVAVMATEPAGPGRWGVTVGVLRTARLEAWQVTVAEQANGAVVETLPAPVAAPTAGQVPTPAVSPLRPPATDDELAVAVQGFLAALLGADGDLRRYIASDAPVVPPQVAVAEVQLRRIADGPVGQQQRAVLAELRTTGADGAVAISHLPLLVQRTEGRWEVQRLLPALPVHDPDPDPDPDPDDSRRSR